MHNWNLETIYTLIKDAEDCPSDEILALLEKNCMTNGKFDQAKLNRYLQSRVRSVTTQKRVEKMFPINEGDWNRERQLRSTYLDAVDHLINERNFGISILHLALGAPIDHVLCNDNLSNYCNQGNIGDAQSTWMNANNLENLTILSDKINAIKSGNLIANFVLDNDGKVISVSTLIFINSD